MNEYILLGNWEYKLTLDDKFSTMAEENYSEDKKMFDDWLKMYEEIRSGKSSAFLDEDVFLDIIEYLDETQSVKKAAEATEIALTYYPFSSSLLVKKADYQILDRKFDEALITLEHAEAFDNHDVNNTILKIDAYLGLQKEEDAFQEMENALRKFEGEECVDMLLELTDVFDDYEIFEKVFDCLKLILDIEPNNEEALYKICFWTDFTGRNEESITIHHKIIDAYPYNELAWFNLGAAYQGLKLYEKAVDAYKYAVAINEKFDYAYRNMGDAFMRLRKYKEAIDVLKKSLELSRPESVIYEAIGYCYHKMNNGEHARYYYRKAVHLSPTESKLYYKIALTYMDEMQWQQALKSIDTALTFNQTSYEYELVKGECLMNMEEYAEAIHVFGVVVKHRPKSMTGWAYLIRCLYYAEDYVSAAEQSLNAYENTGDKPLFLFYHAFALFATGDMEDALIYLESALHQSPRLFKKVLELNPFILQNHRVVDLLTQFRKISKKQ
ncbi:MAG: tetratricopeptide repeat protein [Arachidicoccus sp.]|nr:tetratricopeptide repeat protein [Arachidicoccus sp.]